MFCSKCGKQIDDGTKFCRECGAPVISSNNSSNTSQPRQSISYNNVANKGSANVPKKSGKGCLITVLIVGGVGLLLLCLVIILGMFFSGGNNDGSQKTESSGKQDVYEYRLADEKLLCEKYGFEKSEDGVYPSFDNPTFSCTDGIVYMVRIGELNKNQFCFRGLSVGDSIDRIDYCLGKYYKLLGTEDSLDEKIFIYQDTVYQDYILTIQATLDADAKVKGITFMQDYDGYTTGSNVVTETSTEDIKEEVSKDTTESISEDATESMSNDNYGTLKSGTYEMTDNDDGVIYTRRADFVYQDGEAFYCHLQAYGDDMTTIYADFETFLTDNKDGTYSGNIEGKGTFVIKPYDNKIIVESNDLTYYSKIVGNYDYCDEIATTSSSELRTGTFTSSETRGEIPIDKCAEITYQDGEAYAITLYASAPNARELGNVFCFLKDEGNGKYIGQVEDIGSITIVAYEDHFTVSYECYSEDYEYRFSGIDGEYYY